LKSNYNKYPSIKITGHDKECWAGWEAITNALQSSIKALGKKKTVVVIEAYPGVDETEVITALRNGLKPKVFINTESALLGPAKMNELTFADVTDDRIFGYMTRLHMEQLFNDNRLYFLQCRVEDAQSGLILVYGTGASLVAETCDILVYADMARWEIQQRMRRHEVNSLGLSDRDLDAASLYKRAYFVDWRVADRLKKKLIAKWDFVLDTNTKDNPKMATGAAVRSALDQAVQQPFRVVPLFDPGPWGGQWMKKKFDLDRSAVNYAWCFDCVPEENSLMLRFGKITMEIPSINLVFYQSKPLLGEKVFARFGAEFPIRFDFLDTMNGGNLSLQVHPLTEYIRTHFGVFYTQDESYYMLDTGDDACVYLGLKEGIQPDLMIAELEDAQATGQFDAEKHVGKWAVKKHDHILIPAGTVHCSGKNSMVLEISATPYIFTFKLWDWGRLGLDGLPRPINIEHGKQNIDWSQTTDWVAKNLINRVETIAEGNGWREERTGLHETEFIETRRHWFSQKVHHDTCGNLNVLNLVQGTEAIVESPTGAFEPFVVHYAETFIIPAALGEYTIRPFGASEGQECATLKAFVRC
jgi:mannose-6-phosphate isomerase class I